MASVYSPYWNKLKQRKVLKIKCPKQLRARLTKAIVKKKWEDKQFAKETRNGYKLKIDPVADGLVFELVPLPHIITAEEM